MTKGKLMNRMTAKTVAEALEIQAAILNFQLNTMNIANRQAMEAAILQAEVRGVDIGEACKGIEQFDDTTKAKT